jgi:mono/diheme cytochrome c family protein
MIRKQTFILTLSSIAALGAIAASAGAQTTSAGPVAGDAEGTFVSGAKFSEPTGELMYKNVCAGCHMPDAMGSQGAGFYPALAKNKKLVAGGYPVAVLLNGMNGMPPVGRMMTDQQVADVVNYVRTHFGNKYKDKVTAEDVKPLR